MAIDDGGNDNCRIISILFNFVLRVLLVQHLQIRSTNNRIKMKNTENSIVNVNDN